MLFTYKNLTKQGVGGGGLHGYLRTTRPLGYACISIWPVIIWPILKGKEGRYNKCQWVDYALLMVFFFSAQFVIT